MKRRPGRPDGWTPSSEADHFMECPGCGERFDMRDLGQALHHDDCGNAEKLQRFQRPETIH